MTRGRILEPLTGILDLLGVGILETGDMLGILLGLLEAERMTWCLGLGLGDGEGEGQLLGSPECDLCTGLTILGPLAGLLVTLAVFLIFGLLSSITRET